MTVTVGNDVQCGPRPGSTGGGEELRSADRFMLVTLAVMRVGTLTLAAAETLGSPPSRLHPAGSWAALLALSAQTVVTLGAAVRRMRHGRRPVLDDRTVIVETIAAISALVALTYAAAPEALTTSTFWVEPYTVVTAVLLAAAARRALLGALGTTALTVTYLLCVVPSVPSGPLHRAEIATAWTNAMSYLPFFGIGALGFGLVHAIVGQADALRQTLARLSAERARVAAAASAYRIGHDIPKALLREVRRGVMSPQTLAPWAVKYRDDLTVALHHNHRRVVDLRAELNALSSAFGATGTLRVDLAALRPELPPRAPKLLLVEATRELLNNATFHAYGYPITLTARSLPARVEIAVTNDGPGVDPVALQSLWARKQNSIHQFQAAGGSYHVESTPGADPGTAITLTWPASHRPGGETAPGPD